MMSRRSALTLTGGVLPMAATARSSGITRHDHRLGLPNGESLFLREVRPASPDAGVVLLLHGARVPALASFDLPVPGGSLAADLALVGHRVYVLDLRGYGGSSRPAAMEAPSRRRPAPDAHG